MAKTEEGGNRATQQQPFPMEVTNFPGDFLGRIISGNDFPGKYDDPTTQDSEENEIELSLGLSLNGRFGVDPRAKLLSLKRSSSIPDFASMPATAREKEMACRRVSPPCAAAAALMRTCSLPTETEEEWRKRKELQSLRRMEAKRKRSEKQQRGLSSKVPRDWRAESCEEDKRGGEGRDAVGSYKQGQEQFGKVVDEFRAMGMPTWVAGDKGGCPIPPVPVPASQGTVGSQGSGSSGISESESHAAAAQGMHQCTEARSHSNVQCSPKSEKQHVVIPRMLTTERSGQFNEVQMENNCNKPPVPEKGANEIVRNVLENMPSVSTKGDGPNGKRIEGFLYRYKKGEEVRIVCVCHGSFLSPAEFVKHAGGSDVAHPLKHIVVNPTPFL